jgi:hypothetical protein
MAQGITLISGSPLIGSPIVYRVTPESYAANRTFHRIIVRVYAALETDADYTTFDFSTPVETKQVNGDYVTVASDFDISSALQAVADKYEYDAEPPTRYPYIKFRVEAWDEWMANGSISTRQGVKYWPGTPETIGGGSYDFFAYAFMGSWTDLERMKAPVDQGGVEYLSLSNMSRKPSSPEVIYKAANDSIKFIYPATFNRSIGDTDYATGEGSARRFVSGAPDNGPKSVVYTPQDEGAVTVGTHNLYVIDEPADAYILRFINGMGCMESLHVESLVKREVPITTDKHTVAKQETLKKFSRSVVRKSNDRETWSLTSGALDREWASWYIHEFLMSEQVWIQMGTLWIPCHVVPEETTVLEDRQKAQPYEVQFRLEMDINGSPL